MNGRKIKVLWLCSNRFSTEAKRNTGTWTQPLAEQLNNNGRCEVCNITFGMVASVQKEQCNGITQYVLPKPKSILGKAPLDVCRMVSNIEQEVQPDLVHIWGTEAIFASIYAQGYIKAKTLIDIQGLIYISLSYYYGGLTFIDQLHTISLMELLHPRGTLWWKKKMFWDRGKIEKDCLRRFEHISVQSRWVEDNIRDVAPQAKIYNTRIMLRKAFYEAAPWQWHEPGSHPIVFTSSSALLSYKGFHVLVRALAILKRKYPDIELRVAGCFNIYDKHADGYAVFVRNLIDECGVKGNITFLGSLDATAMIAEMQRCNAVCVPSFVETYCLGFAEPMLLGVPCVATFSAALPNLADSEKEALFYNAPDHVTCAAQIERILSDKELATRLSVNARARRQKENDQQAVADTQIAIYENILGVC